MVVVKIYPGLVNRSAFYTYGSVGIMPDRRQDTGSNLTSTFLLKKRVRFPKTYLPGSPDTETKGVGQRAAVYGTDAPKIPPFRGGERGGRAL